VVVARRAGGGFTMTGRFALGRRLAAGAACAAFVTLSVAGVHGWPQAGARQKPAKKDAVARAGEPWPEPARLAERRAAAENLPLFRSQETLSFTLASDFAAINRDRDPQSTRQFPGTLQVTGGTGTPIPVQVGARGHARRNPLVCEMVPIRLDFEKKDVAGTVFEGQGELKLVTHCNNRNGEQYVLTEYLAYRIYNLFTPRSFRARLVKVSYVGPKPERSPVPRYGMLLENDDDVARRMEGRAYTVPNRLFNYIEPDSLLLMMMFEYMIANTDISIMGLHNVKLVQVQPATLYPVPYDFDYSGFVNTGYGAVDTRLDLASVRDRLYRGPCRTMAEYAPVLAAFNAKKGDVVALIDQMPDMTPNRRQDARAFLEEFFAVASNPAKAKRVFVDQCKKAVGI
jgi:hypothetical protein